MTSAADTHEVHPPAWNRRRACIYLFAAAACLYFASMSREITWGDARPVYEVAESLVAGKGLSVTTRWPSDAPPGRGGAYYAAQPLLPSLAHLPGAAIRGLISHVHPSAEVAHLVDVLACHLSGALLGALVVVLFFRLCLFHGASPRVAGFAAVSLGAGSILWVYARYPFTEIVQVTCFTGFFYALSRLLRRLDARTAIATGLWAGMLLNTKYIYALSLPGAFLLVVLFHWKARRELMLAAARVALGMLPGIAMVLLYNYLRYGSITQTGYTKVGGVMVENVWLSMWGFFFSPGKSLFFYVPPLVLAVFGIVRFWRGHRPTVLAMVATILPVMLFYSRLPSWPGDWAWGPRYLVFAVPVLLLPAISFLSCARWPGKSVAGVLLIAGICVQLLGNAFYWDHFLRIALDVRTKWLGKPNRAASLSVDKGGFCEGCFEDVYPTVWLPPLEPILGHFWLARHVPFGDDWHKASQDAPWRRHTRLDVDASATYQRARVDHWLLETHAHRTLGWALLLLLVGGFADAGFAFARRVRTRDDVANSDRLCYELPP
jgi:hypothetical protein